MADVQITDQLDKPIEKVKIDLSQPSSLIKYLKTEALHLAVFPDFLARKDSSLSQAAPKPIQFQGKAQHKFQLGNTKPEIDLTPEVQSTIRVNASPGTNLFEGDRFHLPAKVPADTGYVSVGFQGSLDFGVSGSEGDLTFGFNRTGGVSLEYFKAFSLGAGEPTLGDALGQTMSCYVIPADVSDLELLAINDIATVSGAGSLKVCAGVCVTASPNPLASVDLPLGIGAFAVKAGASAAFNAMFEISGSYQIRVLRQDPETIQLSISPESGTNFKADFSLSAGVTAKVKDMDLLGALLGLISTDPTKDRAALADLQPSEVKTLTSAIKDGLDHSFRACVDVALSHVTDDQVAFQYEIQPAKLSPEASEAVHKALDGDLTLLTSMEDSMQTGGVLAPGLKMLNSVVYETRKRGVGVKVNLLGILNYSSLSELIRHSEILTDDASGDITIKESVTGNTISSLSNPLDKAEALRKAMFNSVLATVSYRAGRAIPFPDLNCEQVHFVLNQNTNQQTMREYLNWLVALNLLNPGEEQALLANFASGGQSTCVLRTSFGDHDCTSMFFDDNGKLHQKPFYLEFGRRAMRALLEPQDNPNDRLRYRIVDDALWPRAVQMGASSELATLVDLSTEDPRLIYVIGDVKVITDWANAMIEAGLLIEDMRKFVGDADPTALFQNNQFKSKREALQKKLASMVKASKTRFEDPWGMVCLFWAAGSPRTAYAKATTQRLTIEKGAERAFVASGT